MDIFTALKKEASTVTGYDKFFGPVGEKLESFDGFNAFLARLTKGPERPPNKLENQYKWMTLEEAKQNYNGGHSETFNATMDEVAARIKEMSKFTLCGGQSDKYS